MDPPEAYDRWHSWRVEGTATQLSSVLAHLDANLPAGWRKPGNEEVPQLDILLHNGATAYCLDATPDHIAVSLSVVPIHQTVLRGGQVWFGGSRRPPAKAELPAVWAEILRFVDQGVKPAAEGVAARVWVPSTADLFFAELPRDIRDRLQTFSAHDDKSLPLGKDATRLWQEFVVAAFRSETLFDSDSMKEWLISQGWPTPAATELVSRFFDQCTLLTRYVDELAAV